MARTTHKAVKDVLGPNYDPTACPDLTPLIRTADRMIDRVVTCAVAKGVTLTTGEKADLATYLAAHLYTRMDPVYTSKNTGRAGGSFVRDPKTPEPYKAVLLEIDPSGCLAAIMNRQTAGGFWLGRSPSEQTAYEDRR